MARPSTETVMHPPVTNALPGHLLPDAFVEMFPGDLETSRARLIAALSNPIAVERALNAVGTGCLVLLEALLECGGQIELNALRILLAERFKWTTHHFEAALEEASAQGLALRAVFPQPYGTDVDCLFVLREMSAAMAGKVMGVSLPRVPKSLPTEALTPEGTQLRDRLARTAATLHFPVRAAQGGQNVNRTTIRKLAGATGLSDLALYDELGEAIRNGALDAHRDLVAPSVQTLRALASRRRPWSSDPAEQLLHAWVGEGKWVAEEALVRALAIETRIPSRPIWTARHAYHPVGGVELAHAREVVARTEFLRREVEGETFVHALVHSEKAGGDGHVTPSLEVMLGPEANLDLTVTIALCAEPVRFDRVLTFKLTQASISAAVSAGLDRASVLDALARVGRHALPGNVVAMVEDWMRSARSARIRAAWVIELSSAEAADVAMKALGANVIARPSPTLLLVDQSLSKPESLLAKHGIRVKDSSAQDAQAPTHKRAGVVDEVFAGSPRGEMPTPPFAFSPPAALCEKVAKAKRTSFPAEVTAASKQRLDDAHSEERAPHEPPWEILRARAIIAAQPSERGFLELAAAILQRAGAPVGEWILKLPQRDAAEALALSKRAPLALLEFASLNAKTRGKLLRTQTSMPNLIREANRAVGPTTIDPETLLIWRMVEEPEFAALLKADRRAANILEAAPAEALAPMRSKPTLAQLPPEESGAVQGKIEAAVSASQVIWMHVSSKAQGDRVVLFKPERITVRGNETLVLGTDVEAEEGRSFPLASVKAVRIRA